MKPHLRRNMLILALGIGFLVLTASFGMFISRIDDTPRQTNPSTQKKQVGPYDITLQVSPNPPSVSNPATITIQIVRTETRQLVTNAQVHITSEMEEMNMGTTQSETKLQKNGTYATSIQFPMSGSWLLYVRIEVPGASSQNTSFEVTSH